MQLLSLITACVVVAALSLPSAASPFGLTFSGQVRTALARVSTPPPAASAAWPGMVPSRGLQCRSASSRHTCTHNIQGTYYGVQNPMGSGQCSFASYNLNNGPAPGALPVAINAAQWAGAALCGLCVRFRGTGAGTGVTPISSAWQAGFICDQCPECLSGDLDLQSNGDGRWAIEWEAQQCSVGTSKFVFGHQVRARAA